MWLSPRINSDTVGGGGGKRLKRQPHRISNPGVGTGMGLSLQVSFRFELSKFSDECSTVMLECTRLIFMQHACKWIVVIYVYVVSFVCILQV
jgi:hypothetical protein